MYLTRDRARDIWTLTIFVRLEKLIVNANPDIVMQDLLFLLQNSLAKEKEEGLIQMQEVKRTSLEEREPT
jgi:hypothetical protein